MANRLWRAPLIAHAGVLAACLLGLMVLVGTNASLSEDEGAALVQARQLAEHHTWVDPHPLPTVDPSGAFYPYRLADVGTDGPVPFGRHPLYAVVLAGLWRLGHNNAVIMLSLAGTVAAALAAAVLARRFDERLARPALWAAGLGTPLFFDSFLAIAHTVGAALAGWLVVAVTRRAGDRPLLGVVVGAVLAGVLVMVRTEGVLFVGVAALVAFAFTEYRVAAVAAGAGGVVGFVANLAWERHIFGASVTVVSSTGGAVAQSHDLMSRARGAYTTLLRYSYPNGARANVLLLVAFVVVAVAGLLARRRRDLAAALTGVAALLVLLRALSGTAPVVPGLFVVCPVLWAAVWSGGFSWRDRAVRVFVALLVGFAAAVVATQYERGGGIEWGGRYFALGLPVAIAVAVRAFLAAPRAVVAGLAAVSLAFAALAASALRSTHEHTHELLAAIPKHGLAITTAGLLPRLDWPNVDTRQWLLVEPAKVPVVLRRLRAAGVGRVAVVYPGALTPRGFAHQGKPVGGLDWRVAEVSL
ncbi:MAG TPA: hypothetical protein VHC63_08940 [Acidimicrobiales bacterium]|nr:hypothetical protein [Acidimicrobiales bacterium]